MSNKRKFDLFDDSDDDTEQLKDVLDSDYEDYESKLETKIEQSSSKRTSKLIELQSKFAADPRFTVDDRFIDDDDDDDDDADDDESNNKEAASSGRQEIVEEKSKNLSILEHVLGKSIPSKLREDSVTEFRKAQVPKKVSKNFAGVLTPRFDPSKEESKIYEIQEERGTKKVNIDFDELDRREADAKRKKLKTGAALSSSSILTKAENFFEVNVNLKDSIGDTSNFTFDTLIQAPPTKDIHAINDAAVEVPFDTTKKTFGQSQTKNPFKYDSSDDEGDDKADDPAEVVEQGEETTVDASTDKAASGKKKSSKTSGPAKERKRVVAVEFTGFFFKKNDPRLVEDLFYTPDLVKSVKADAEGRKDRMRKALNLRKKAAQKNAQLKKRIESKRQTMTPKQIKRVQRISTGRKFKRKPMK